MQSGSVITDGARSRIAVGLAQLVGLASRVWKQRGLGTMYSVLGRLPLLRDTSCVVELSPGSFLETEVFEPYWSPAVLGGRPYEPELLYLLQRLRGLDATLVDCGANCGYWSIVATSQDIGFPRAVAIEPNPATFKRLHRNADLNRGRFRALERAISDSSGQAVTLAFADRHAVAHVDERLTDGVRVQTITVDRALEEMGWSDHDQLVVKLDVEGSELKAIAGAERMRERSDHIFIIEDWKSNDFEVSAFLLGHGYRLYYVTQAGRCHTIRAISEIDTLLAADTKVDHGTNFVAVRPGGRFVQRMDAWMAEAPT